MPSRGRPVFTTIRKIYGEFADGYADNDRQGRRKGDQGKRIQAVKDQ
jgi:hypothetical protein